jgi:hypothetical protein
MSPRNAGRLFLFVGIGGVITGLVVAAIAFIAVDRIAAGADQTLDIAATTISDVDAALDAAAATTRGAGESLAGLSEAIGDSAATLEGSRTAMNDLARFIGTDLASSIQSVVSGLPALIRVGDALDETVTTLSGVGVVGAPDLSAGVAIRDLSTSLTPVPGQLTSQGGTLRRLGADLGEIISRSDTTIEDLALVQDGLRQAEESLDRFTATASRLEALIEDSRDALDLGRVLGFVVVGLLAFIFIGLQAVPIYVGVRLRRPDLPETVAAILRDKAEASSPEPEDSGE